jgi:hypothetical protein
MQELTQYLSANIESVLIGLPTEMKELIYFDALSRAANSIQVSTVFDISPSPNTGQALPLDPSVKKITPAAARLLSQDVEHLAQFVTSLRNPILKENLDELVQTVALMQTTDPDEFFDVSQANKKYGRVDRNNGAILLEKFDPLSAVDSTNLPVECEKERLQLNQRRLRKMSAARHLQRSARGLELIEVEL